MNVGLGRGARVLLASALLAGAVLLPQPTDAYHKCKGTQNCTAYTRGCHKGWGWCPWPTNDKGIVHIHFWVNPHTQSWLTEEEAVGASRWAARTWERSNPNLRLHYHGTTTDLPYPGDNKIVIGWVPIYGAGQASYTAPDTDIRLNITNHWVWKPCKWSCPDFDMRSDSIMVGDAALGVTEVQWVITHEWGHVLGLGHPSRSHGDICALTMDGTLDTGSCRRTTYSVSREKSTLALGDILGAKKLYPWECPAPKKGVSGRKAYPKPWRHICPTIKVYTP